MPWGRSDWSNTGGAGDAGGMGGVRTLMAARSSSAFGWYISAAASPILFCRVMFTALLYQREVRGAAVATPATATAPRASRAQQENPAIGSAARPHWEDRGNDSNRNSIHKAGTGRGEVVPVLSEGRTWNHKQVRSRGWFGSAAGGLGLEGS